MRQGDDVKRVEVVRGFVNVQRPSKLASGCFCGLFSVKCCREKRMLSKVSCVHKNNFKTISSRFNGGASNKRRL